MKWKNLLIVLSVALNVGLVVCLVTGPSGSGVFLPQSFAQNRAVSGGGYAATTADIRSSRQALWVVDNTEKRLILYDIPSITKGVRIEILANRDLRRDFGADLAGDIMLLPGNVSGQAEAVYAIDAVGKKLIAYYSQGRGITVLGARDLGKDFKR